MINNETFLTDMMKFASMDDDPNEIIQKFMQFICEKLHSDRAYIFEMSEDGNFDNTYEYCREGVPPEIDNLQGVSFDVLNESWFEEYRKSGNVMIYDLEEYRTVSKKIYDILKPKGVNTIVTGPIILNGEYIGLYGVDNPTKEIMKEISALISTMEIIICMMLRIRDYAKMIEKKTEIDVLTKCKNRRALDGIYNKKMPGSIALLMCDLNGLKALNDKNGHVAGDRHICSLAELLMEIFGLENVYRLGGDEFLVVDYLISQGEMEEKVERFEEKCDERGISVSIGLEYRDSTDETFEQVLNAADEKMYDSKRAYYSSFRDNRPAKKEVKNDTLNNILYEALADASENVYLYVSDMNTGLSRWSKHSVEYFGLPDEYMENAGEIWLEHIHPNDKDMYLEDITNVFEGKSKRHSCQYRAKNRFGQYVWVECKGKVITGANGNNVFAGMMTRLDNQSAYDPLTGLKTKNQFYEYDFTNESGVVFLLGIDYFKRLVNVYGYENSDEVLIQVGKVFLSLSDESKKVYRFNGDEFVFVLPNGTVEDVTELFQEIYKRAGKINLEDGQKIELSFSAGAVIYPLENGNTDMLVNRLELSLGHVKSENRGCLVFYSEDIIKREKRRRLLKKELRDSIDNDFRGFELYYQPWMDKAGKRVVGCEALLRWKGEQIKDSYPGEFIPILEETEDIITVGRFVMREAMKQQKEWEKKYGSILVSFNVSYRQFLEENYVEEVKAAAKYYGVNPNNMVIELTESNSVQAPDILADVFARLRDAGFRLALDDFGTGYASLEMFKKLPSDGIKIEHSFVRELAKEGHDIDLAIIKSILFLCKDLGQYVVVEGVENEEVDEIVRSLEPGYLQGYFYSKPICKSEFEEYIEKQQCG